MAYLGLVTKTIITEENNYKYKTIITEEISKYLEKRKKRKNKYNNYILDRLV